MSKKKENIVSDSNNITNQEHNSLNDKNNNSTHTEVSKEKIEKEGEKKMECEITEKVDEVTTQNGEKDNELKVDNNKENYEEKIKDLEKKLSDKNDSYLRLMAEFDNYKKRVAKEYERMVEFANEKLILELIGVKESFELALKHSENNKENNQLLEGIKLIYNKFDSILSANGLSWFGEKGEEFDPQLHDALMKTPHPEIEDGHIAEIYEKGYKLKDRIIKHAKVIVSSGKPIESTESSNNTSNCDEKSSN